MAVYLMTNDAEKLLADFKNKIRQGHIVTWSCDADGDFTHTPQQWAGKAWLRPRVLADRLCLGLLKRKDASMTWPVYSVFHGRFIESMVEHCNQLFTSAQATPNGVPQVDLI